MAANADRYEIAAYRPEFRAGLLELQRHMWGPNPERNAVYLEWKYERNPYSNDSFIYVALCDGQVVGMRTMYVTEWEAGQPSQRFLCLSDADGVIHPDHRRRGLLERMTRATLEEVARHDREYSITLSANPASAAHNLKLGWHSAGSVETASRPANRGTESRLRALAAKVPLLAPAYRQVRQRFAALRAPSDSERPAFDALDGTQAQLDGRATSHIVIDRSPRPEAMAELVDRSGSDGRIRHTRDQRFFAWRFQNPLSVYRFFFWEDSRLEGYLVLQTAAGATENAWIRIVDWESTNLQVRAELLQAAVEHSHAHQLVIWSASLPDEVKALLRDHGFAFSDMTKDISDGIWHPHVLLRPVRRDIPQAQWTFAGRDLLDLA
ncbi:MAG: GNAT family N-acetyltransferase, partial [Anaerolineae bacterium]|nr:GNAT family N-acetyltransferase [Anaerolineae bacterium]